MRHNRSMRIHVAADHAGYELKVALIEHLSAGGRFDIVDHGAVAFRYPSNHYVALPRVSISSRSRLETA